MKAVEAIVLLIAIGGAGAALAGSRLTNWRAARAPWRLVEDADGELVCVYAARPGRERLLLGSVPIAAEDFDSRLYELRAEARHKLAALNEKG